MHKRPPGWRQLPRAKFGGHHALGHLVQQQGDVAVASRQGVHWPQLSWEKNSWVMRRKPMTLVRSSTTSTAPEPMAVRSA